MSDALTLALISPGLENFLYVALGSILTGIGYPIKRKLERKPQLDDLEVNERVLKLMKDISSQNLTIDDLHERREHLLNPSNRLAAENRRQRALIAEHNRIVLEVVRYMDGVIFQSKVLHHLDHKLGKASDAMWAVADQLIKARYTGDFDGSKSFFDDQREWNETAEAEAETARQQHDDPVVGMIIFFAEKEAAVQARTVFLQRALAERTQKAVLEAPPDTQENETQSSLSDTLEIPVTVQRGSCGCGDFT